MINNKLKTNLYLEQRHWYENTPSPFWYSKAQFTFLTTSFYFTVGLLLILHNGLGLCEVGAFKAQMFISAPKFIRITKVQI